MEFGVINETVYKSFSVVDSEGNMVSGLTGDDFTVNLFDPDGNDVNGSLGINIIELQNGHYRVSFVPKVDGEYFIVVYNSEYFSNGKTGTVRVYNDDFNSLGSNQKLILGLVHQNMFIDNTVFDDNNNLIRARIRIYSDSDSVGTDNNILASYQINVSSNGPGRFESWMQIKE